MEIMVRQEIVLMRPAAREAEVPQPALVDLEDPKRGRIEFEVFYHSIKTAHDAIKDMREAFGPSMRLYRADLTIVGEYDQFAEVIPDNLSMVIREAGKPAQVRERLTPGPFGIHAVIFHDIKHALSAKHEYGDKYVIYMGVVSNLQPLVCGEVLDKTVCRELEFPSDMED